MTDTTAAEKSCTKCGICKPLTDFPARRNRSSGRQPSCRRCASDATADWRARNPEAHRRTSRNSVLKRTYGITLDEYEALRSSQGGGCAICGSSEPQGKGDFHVDHCHKTGTVRGLLCTTCNVGLGALRDDPDLLRLAITYLERDKT